MRSPLPLCSVSAVDCCLPLPGTHNAARQGDSMWTFSPRRTVAATVESLLADWAMLYTALLQRDFSQSQSCTSSYLKAPRIEERLATEEFPILSHGQVAVMQCRCLWINTLYNFLLSSYADCQLIMHASIPEKCLPQQLNQQADWEAYSIQINYCCEGLFHFNKPVKIKVEEGQLY